MDAIFKALTDPTRRALLDSLRAEDGQTLSQLEENLEMTRFGVMKHLKVLETAGLIVTVKRGRFKHHYLNALPLQEVIDRWIDPFLAKPAARAVLDLKSQLEGTPPMSSEKPDFVMSTFIRCSQDALWDALQNPDAVSHYHFMADRAAMEGGKMTMFTPDGKPLMSAAVIEADPKSRIVTTFEPHWEEMPASRVVYLIGVEGPHCRLTIEHYGLNFPVVAGEGVADGWERWAAGLKSWLETGEDAHFGSLAEAAQ
ncbi:MAG: helix-turn-helix domain-containing protein [Pseudomonadota bacterium]